MRHRLITTTNNGESYLRLFPSFLNHLHIRAFLSHGFLSEHSSCKYSRYFHSSIPHLFPIFISQFLVNSSLNRSFIQSFANPSFTHLLFLYLVIPYLLIYSSCTHSYLIYCSVTHPFLTQSFLNYPLTPH